MPAPGTIRLEPIIRAIGVIVVIWTVGIPFRSSSLVITAPQRVLVPQVEVRMTVSTPLSFIAATMPWAIFFAFANDVATPAVV